jgi:hypothetical protein
VRTQNDVEILAYRIGVAVAASVEFSSIGAGPRPGTPGFDLPPAALACTLGLSMFSKTATALGSPPRPRGVR